MATRTDLLAALGLHGLSHLDAPVLAALATESPMLLIGPHGSAKSALLERLAAALGLAHRHYNASLLSFDDLVGFPVPEGEGLRYLRTPATLWDAQSVFLDEISRCRPEVQNKLFSIIHERRVQGIPLEKLRYRWAAMNPPPGFDSGDHDEENDAYLGAEPLDPALADRFAFLLEVPGWADLTTAEKEELLADQFRGRHEFPVDVPALVTRTRERLALLTARPPALASYFIALETQLRAAGTRFSSRRISMLLRSALGIHAARGVLAAGSAAAPDWETSLFLAVAHGHPGLAAGPIDRGALLALHRQAWNLARLDPNDPWRTLLGLTDPVERVAAASLGHLPLKESDLSSLVLEAVAAQPGPEERAAVSFVLYLHLRDTPRITAAAAETLAGQLTRVLRPAIDTHQVHGRQLTLCREVASLCASLGDSPRDAYARNLLNAFLPAGFTGITPARLLTRFRALWDRFQLTAAAPAP